VKSIISLGEVLVDIIPSSPLQLGAACYSPHAGGAPANVAVAIARLGGSSRFLGTVSDDEFGRLLVQVLIDNHVDVNYIRTLTEAPTAIALVTLSADGQRHFTFFRQGTADMLLQTEYVNWSAWDDAAICHTGGVLLSDEPARSATLAAMDHTHQIGSIVSFDVNARPALWTSSAVLRDMMTKTVERTDILKLSADECEFVDSQSSLPITPSEKSRLNALGRALLEKGPSLVIITRGPLGALLLTEKHQIDVPAMSVRPVDTTGAGDAFMGAVLSQLVQLGCSTPSDLRALSVEDLNQLGHFANQVAGLSSTRYGGISSFPFLQDINSASSS